LGTNYWNRALAHTGTVLWAQATGTALWRLLDRALGTNYWNRALAHTGTVLWAHAATETVLWAQATGTALWRLLDRALGTCCWDRALTHTQPHFGAYWSHALGAYNWNCALATIAGTALWAQQPLFGRIGHSHALLFIIALTNLCLAQGSARKCTDRITPTAHAVGQREGTPLSFIL